MKKYEFTGETKQVPSLDGNTVTYIKDGQLKRVTCGRHEEAVEFYEEVRHGKKMV